MPTVTTRGIKPLNPCHTHTYTHTQRTPLAVSFGSGAIEAAANQMLLNCVNWPQMPASQSQMGPLDMTSRGGGGVTKLRKRGGREGGRKGTPGCHHSVHLQSSQLSSLFITFLFSISPSLSSMSLPSSPTIMSSLCQSLGLSPVL